MIGGAGGTKITTGVTIAMFLNLWLGYDIKQAIDARRLHHQVEKISFQDRKLVPLIETKIKMSYY